MTNRANEWKKTRKKELIKKLSPTKHGCHYPNCKVTAPSRLRFDHVTSTPLSRTGVGNREMKVKFADINKHPKAYQVSCDNPAHKSVRAIRHDRLMRSLGKKPGYSDRR